jgi:hypothetical protein
MKMATGDETPVDVRLNEWSFDEESAGFMLRGDDAIVIYLWERSVIPSILEEEARMAIAKDPIYVYHENVLGPEKIDRVSATCFASDKDGAVVCYPGPISRDEVMGILVRVDPRFRRDKLGEWNFE